jgi:hypothetical protein
MQHRYTGPLLNAYKFPFGLGIGFPSALKQFRSVPVNELINSFLTSGSFLNTFNHNMEYSLFQFGRHSEFINVFFS